MYHRMNMYLHRFNAIDESLCLTFNRTSRHSWVRLPFQVISRLGDGVFWYTLMAGILLTQLTEGIIPVLHMAIAGLAATVTYKCIKGRASRPRPYEVIQSIHLGMMPLDRFSFPSGHTLHAVVFSLVAISYYPVLAWVLLPFTLLVAMSRVILGLHYPTDVLVGAVLGGIIVKLSMMF
jgi:undecaprenyl-diphosphatase